MTLDSSQSTAKAELLLLPVGFLIGRDQLPRSRGFRGIPQDSRMT